MKKGEVDAVFPVNQALHDGETGDILVSNSVVTTQIYAVTGKRDAVPGSGADRGPPPPKNSGYEAFMEDRLPG